MIDTKNKEVSSTYHVPDTVLSTLYTGTHFSLTTFHIEKMEAYERLRHFLGVTQLAVKLQKGNKNGVWLPLDRWVDEKMEGRDRRKEREREGRRTRQVNCQEEGMACSVAGTVRLSVGAGAVCADKF